MRDKKLGYLAIEERSGFKISLNKTEHPRKHLLDRLGKKSCRKMYCDTENGESRHIGYVVGPEWYRIMEVHSWEGGAK